MCHALRHRPDHIVGGEVRGAEAADLLQALNTGHGGSLATVHANNAEAALSRPRRACARAVRKPEFSIGGWRRDRQDCAFESFEPLIDLPESDLHGA